MEADKWLSLGEKLKKTKIEHRMDNPEATMLVKRKKKKDKKSKKNRELKDIEKMQKRKRREKRDEVI